MKRPNWRRWAVEPLEDRRLLAVTFTGIGQSANASSLLGGLSGDGKVVVGYTSTAGQNSSFRWTAESGMVALHPDSSAYAASFDGAVVVGQTITDSFHWTETDGFKVASDPQSPRGLSEDGSVTVGYNTPGGGSYFAYRNGTQIDSGQANGVSADGGIVVGWDGAGHAFRWTEATGATTITDGSAFAVSADGKTIVGRQSVGTVSRAFRWTSESGVQLLADNYSEAYGVSGDGSVVVGRTATQSPFGNERAFVYDEVHGLRDLADYLTSEGIDLTGWKLKEARAVSWDGRIIAGNGINPKGLAEPWLVDLSVNEAPTDISLVPASVPENTTTGTWVGALSTTDPDQGDSFTFALLNDAGGRFTLDGSQLKVSNGALLDYESATSQTIRVKTTDSGGLSFEKDLVIQVTNVNEAPTDLKLSHLTVPENSPNGFVIGTLLATDPDVGDTFTYSLTNTAGGRFRLVDNHLVVDNGGLLNFETAQDHKIRVKATDAGGLSVEKDFDITVTDVNEPPVGLQLSASLVPENSPGGTVVGKLSATDPDQAPTGLVLLYNPVDGSTRLKNFGPTEIRTDAYQIDSTAAKLDPDGWQTVQEWAAQPNGLSDALLILGPGENTVVTGWDSAGSSSAFLSEFNLADEAVLSPGESWPIGKPFVAFDPADLTFEYRDVGDNGGVVKVGPVLLDAPDGLTYSLVDSAGGRFQIVGSELQVAPGAFLDYEGQQSFPIRVRVTDAGGLSEEEDFSVTLTNVNEAPVIAVPPVNVSTPGGVLPLSGISVSDPDLLGADLDTKPLRLSLTADHGTVQLGSVVGLTIVSGANGSPSVTVEGAVNALNAALGTLSHKAAQDFSGVAHVSLDLNDLGHSGEGSPLSTSVGLGIHVDTPPVAQPDHYEIGFGRTLNAQSYSQAVLDSGPLAYWRLGDSGPIVEDSAGNYEGTTSAATVLGLAGALAGDSNKAAAFPDVNSRILVAGAEALAQPTGAFSVEAWVNPSESLAWQRIASTRNGPDGGWGFALSNQRLAFTTYGIQDYFLEGHPVPTNQWSHVAVVFDANFDASFFLNGSFVGKVDGSAQPNSGGSLFAIGDNPDQSAQPILGKLDEMAFYAKPLTASEVSRHYQAGLLNATVLVNDSDADGDPFHAFLVAQPQHGQLTFAADGSFTYKPNAGFYGQDRFTYRAVDLFFQSAETEVLIDVIPVPGDADLDGDVDLADFGILKQFFGTGTTREQGDFNGDGKVDLADFGLLKQHFGTVEPGNS